MPGETCSDITRMLVQAQCGVAFAHFFTDPNRIQAARKANVKGIALYDIRGGLATAERAAREAAKLLAPGPAQRKARSIAARAKKEKELYQGDGALPSQRIPQLRQSMNALGGRFNSLLSEVRTSCGAAPPPSPSPQPAAVGRRRR